MKAPYKTEGDVAKASRGLAMELQKTFDTLYGGLAEKNSTLSSDPRPVLDTHRVALEALLDASATTHLRLDTHLLVLALCRPLSLQHGVATRDPLGRASATDLAAIHGWSFRMLALVLGRAPTLNVPLSAVQIKYFVSHYHVELTKGAGLEMFQGLMDFLFRATGQEALHSVLVQGCIRELLECTVSLLKLRQAALRSTPSATSAGSSRKKISLGKGETTPSVPVSDVSLNLIHNVLRWLHGALQLASFQFALPENLYDILAHTLLSSLGSSDVELVCAVLKSLAALILSLQPATLSPHLALFVRVVGAAMHHVSLEVRQEAIRYARQIDLLIRPRRPYSPGKPRARIPESEPETERVFQAPLPQCGKVESTLPVVIPIGISNIPVTPPVVEKPRAPESPKTSTLIPSESSPRSLSQIISPPRPDPAPEFKIPLKRPVELADLLKDEILPQLIDEGPDDE